MTSKTVNTITKFESLIEKLKEIEIKEQFNNFINFIKLFRMIKKVVRLTCTHIGSQCVLF
jgi:hypothetical protein